MTDTKPILYSFRRCPYAIRARLALLAAEQSVIHREVLLRDKPKHMLDISPKGTVPVLLLPDGKVIDESIDIMRWSLQLNDPHDWLNISMQEADTLISSNDNEFKQHLDHYKYADRFPHSAVDYRQQGEVFLQLLEQRLTHQVFLLSDKISFADAAILPFIRQFAFVDKVWFDQAAYPKLRQWLNNGLISEIFQLAMIKQKNWQPHDPPILFPH